MNGFMAVVGYCVIVLAVLLVLAIAVGRFFDRKPDAEPEDWDPAPRRLTPHVPPQWQQFSDDNLDDLEPRTSWAEAKRRREPGTPQEAPPE